MNKKKIIFIGMMLLMGIVMVYTIFDYNKPVIEDRFDGDKKQAIQEAFDITLPDNGQILLWDVKSYENMYISSMAVELAINKKDFDLLFEQIDDKYRHSPFIELNEEAINKKYESNAENIEYKYYAWMTLVNSEEEIYKNFVDRYIFIMEESNGTVNIILAANDYL